MFRIPDSHELWVSLPDDSGNDRLYLVKPDALMSLVNGTVTKVRDLTATEKSLATVLLDVCEILNKHDRIIGLDPQPYIRSLTDRLAMVIESHRYLRSLNLEVESVTQARIEDGRKRGREAGYAEVTKGEYIKVEDLKKLTVHELAERIAGDS